MQLLVEAEAGGRGENGRKFLPDDRNIAVFMQRKQLPFQFISGGQRRLMRARPLRKGRLRGEGGSL
jgi:hypothetical protein